MNDSFIKSTLLSSENCFLPGWFSWENLKVLFDCCKYPFNVCARDKTFPKPIILSKKTRIWNLDEVVDFLAAKGCQLDEDFGLKPTIVDKKTLGHYLGISNCQVSKLISTDGFPTPVTNYSKKNYYEVSSIDFWLKSRRELGFFSGNLPQKVITLK